MSNFCEEDLLKEFDNGRIEKILNIEEGNCSVDDFELLLQYVKHLKAVNSFDNGVCASGFIKLAEQEIIIEEKDKRIAELERETE